MENEDGNRCGKRNQGGKMKSEEPHQRIFDEGDLRKYRTEIPNLIDDLELSIYERALYLHYKRVCGASEGACWESVRRTAEHIGVSKSQVQRIRRELEEKELITCWPSSKGTIEVRIVDIWPLNYLWFSILKPRNGKPPGIRELRARFKQIQEQNQLDQNQSESSTNEPPLDCPSPGTLDIKCPSPGTLDIKCPPPGTAVPPQGHTVPPVVHKKEPLKKEPIKKTPTSVAILDDCFGSPSIRPERSQEEVPEIDLARIPFLTSEQIEELEGNPGSRKAAIAQAVAKGLTQKNPSWTVPEDAGGVDTLGEQLWTAFKEYTGLGRVPKKKATSQIRKLREMVKPYLDLTTEQILEAMEVTFLDDFVKRKTTTVFYGTFADRFAYCLGRAAEGTLTEHRKESGLGQGFSGIRSGNGRTHQTGGTPEDEGGIREAFDRITRERREASQEDLPLLREIYDSAEREGRNPFAALAERLLPKSLPEKRRREIRDHRKDPVGLP